MVVRVRLRWGRRMIWSGHKVKEKEEKKQKKKKRIMLMRRRSGGVTSNSFQGQSNGRLLTLMAMRTLILILMKAALTTRMKRPLKKKT